MQTSHQKLAANSMQISQRKPLCLHPSKQTQYKTKRNLQSITSTHSQASQDLCIPKKDDSRRPDSIQTLILICQLTAGHGISRRWQVEHDGMPWKHIKCAQASGNPHTAKWKHGTPHISTIMITTVIPSKMWTSQMRFWHESFASELWISQYIRHLMRLEVILCSDIRGHRAKANGSSSR